MIATAISTRLEVIARQYLAGLIFFSIKWAAQAKMASVGTVWHKLFFMGKRGPKPPDFGSLNFWEFEFYKAFHGLRDGTSLPIQYVSASGLSVEETQTFISRLERMSPADYYLTTRRVAVELGENLNLKKPPTGMDVWWAEHQRSEELFWLRQDLDPRRIEAQSTRRRIWNDLVRSNTYAALRKACGRWARLPDVRGAGLVCFPKHVVTNAAQFLSMKQNRRFPRSNYADDSRLEYLARGMAGAVLGMSSMTAIERLRNMKHAPGGPFWVTASESYVLPVKEQYCGCWRCSIEKSNEVSKITRTWYENGQRLFFELASSTRTPKEWKTIRPTWMPPKTRIRAGRHAT